MPKRKKENSICSIHGISQGIRLFTESCEECQNIVDGLPPKSKGISSVYRSYVVKSTDLNIEKDSLGSEKFSENNVAKEARTLEKNHEHQKHMKHETNQGKRAAHIKELIDLILKEPITYSFGEYEQLRKKLVKNIINDSETKKTDSPLSPEGSTSFFGFENNKSPSVLPSEVRHISLTNKNLKYTRKGFIGVEEDVCLQKEVPDFIPWFPRLQMTYPYLENIKYELRELNMLKRKLSDLNDEKCNEICFPLDYSKFDFNGIVSPRYKCEIESAFDDPYDRHLAKIKEMRKTPSRMIIVGKPGLALYNLAAEIANSWNNVLITPLTVLKNQSPRVKEIHKRFNKQLSKGKRIQACDLYLIFYLIMDTLESEEVTHKGYTLAGIPFLRCDVSAEEQLSMIFGSYGVPSSWRPDVIVYAMCPSEDIIPTMESYVLEPGRDLIINMKALERGEHLVIGDKPSEQQWDESSKAMFKQLQEQKGVSYLLQLYISKPYEIMEEVDVYTHVVLPILDVYIMEWDPQCMIRVDGRTPVKQMLEVVNSKLLVIGVSKKPSPCTLFALENGKLMNDYKTIFSEYVTPHSDSKINKINSLNADDNNEEYKDLYETESAGDGETSVLQGADIDPNYATPEGVNGTAENYKQINNTRNSSYIYKGDLSVNKIIEYMSKGKVCFDVLNNMEDEDLLGCLKISKPQVEDTRLSQSSLGALCPVKLHEGFFVRGKAEWSVIYLGTIYLLSSEESQKKFLNDPKKFLDPHPFSKSYTFVYGNPHNIFSNEEYVDYLTHELGVKVLDFQVLHEIMLFYTIEPQLRSYIQKWKTNKIAKLNKEKMKNLKKQKLEFVKDVKAWQKSVIGLIEDYLETVSKLGQICHIDDIALNEDQTDLKSDSINTECSPKMHQSNKNKILSLKQASMLHEVCSEKIKEIIVSSHKKSTEITQPFAGNLSENMNDTTELTENDENDIGSERSEGSSSHRFCDVHRAHGLINLAHKQIGEEEPYKKLVEKSPPLLKLSTVGGSATIKSEDGDTENIKERSSINEIVVKKISGRRKFKKKEKVGGQKLTNAVSEEELEITSTTINEHGKELTKMESLVSENEQEITTLNQRGEPLRQVESSVSEKEVEIMSATLNDFITQVPIWSSDHKKYSPIPTYQCIRLDNKVLKMKRIIAETNRLEKESSLIWKKSVSATSNSLDYRSVASSSDMKKIVESDEPKNESLISLEPSINTSYTFAEKSLEQTHGSAIIKSPRYTALNRGINMQKKRLHTSCAARDLLPTHRVTTKTSLEMQDKFTMGEMVLANFTFVDEEKPKNGSNTKLSTPVFQVVPESPQVEFLHQDKQETVEETRSLVDLILQQPQNLSLYKARRIIKALGNRIFSTVPQYLEEEFVHKKNMSVQTVEPSIIPNPDDPQHSKIRISPSFTNSVLEDAMKTGKITQYSSALNYPFPPNCCYLKKAISVPSTQEEKNSISLQLPSTIVPPGRRCPLHSNLLINDGAKEQRKKYNGTGIAEKNFKSRRIKDFKDTTGRTQIVSSLGIKHHQLPDRDVIRPKFNSDKRTQCSQELLTTNEAVIRKTNQEQEILLNEELKKWAALLLSEAAEEKHRQKAQSQLLQLVGDLKRSKWNLRKVIDYVKATEDANTETEGNELCIRENLESNTEMKILLEETNSFRSCISEEEIIHVLRISGALVPPHCIRGSLLTGPEMRSDKMVYTWLNWVQPNLASLKFKRKGEWYSFGTEDFTESDFMIFLNSPSCPKGYHKWQSRRFKTEAEKRKTFALGKKTALNFNRMCEVMLDHYKTMVIVRTINNDSLKECEFLEEPYHITKREAVNIQKRDMIKSKLSRKDRDKIPVNQIISLKKSGTQQKTRFVIPDSKKLVSMTNEEILNLLRNIGFENNAEHLYANVKSKGHESDIKYLLDSNVREKKRRTEKKIKENYISLSELDRPESAKKNPAVTNKTKEDTSTQVDFYKEEFDHDLYTESLEELSDLLFKLHCESISPQVDKNKKPTKLKTQIRLVSQDNLSTEFKTTPSDFLLPPEFLLVPYELKRTTNKIKKEWWRYLLSRIVEEWENASNVKCIFSLTVLCSNEKMNSISSSLSEKKYSTLKKESLKNFRSDAPHVVFNNQPSISTISDLTTDSSLSMTPLPGSRALSSEQRDHILQHFQDTGSNFQKNTVTDAESFNIDAESLKTDTESLKIDAESYNTELEIMNVSLLPNIVCQTPPDSIHEIAPTGSSHNSLDSVEILKRLICRVVTAEDPCSTRCKEVDKLKKIADMIVKSLTFDVKQCTEEEEIYPGNKNHSLEGRATLFNQKKMLEEKPSKDAIFSYCDDETKTLKQILELIQKSFGVDDSTSENSSLRLSEEIKDNSESSRTQDFVTNTKTDQMEKRLSNLIVEADEIYLKHLAGQSCNIMKEISQVSCMKNTSSEDEDENENKDRIKDIIRLVDNMVLKCNLKEHIMELDEKETLLDFKPRTYALTQDDLLSFSEDSSTLESTSTSSCNSSDKHSTGRVLLTTTDIYNKVKSIIIENHIQLQDCVISEMEEQYEESDMSLSTDNISFDEISKKNPVIYNEETASQIREHLKKLHESIILNAGKKEKMDSEESSTDYSTTHQEVSHFAVAILENLYFFKLEIREKNSHDSWIYEEQILQMESHVDIILDIAEECKKNAGNGSEVFFTVKQAKIIMEQANAILKKLSPEIQERNNQKVPSFSKEYEQIIRRHTMTILENAMKTLDNIESPCCDQICFSHDQFEEIQEQAIAISEILYSLKTEVRQTNSIDSSIEELVLEVEIHVDIILDISEKCKQELLKLPAGSFIEKQARLILEQANAILRRLPFNVEEPKVQRKQIFNKDIRTYTLAILENVMKNLRDNFQHHDQNCASYRPCFKNQICFTREQFQQLKNHLDIIRENLGPENSSLDEAEIKSLRITLNSLSQALYPRNEDGPSYAAIMYNGKESQCIRENIYNLRLAISKNLKSKGKSRRKNAVCYNSEMALDIKNQITDFLKSKKKKPPPLHKPAFMLDAKLFDKILYFLKYNKHTYELKEIKRKVTAVVQEENDCTNKCKQIKGFLSKCSSVSSTNQKAEEIDWKETAQASKTPSLQEMNKTCVTDETLMLEESAQGKSNLDIDTTDSLDSNIDVNEFELFRKEVLEKLKYCSTSSDSTISSINSVDSNGKWSFQNKNCKGLTQVSLEDFDTFYLSKQTKEKLESVLIALDSSFLSNEHLDSFQRINSFKKEVENLIITEQNSFHGKNQEYSHNPYQKTVSGDSEKRLSNESSELSLECEELSKLLKAAVSIEERILMSIECPSVSSSVFEKLFAYGSCASKIDAYFDKLEDEKKQIWDNSVILNHYKLLKKRFQIYGMLHFCYDSNKSFKKVLGNPDVLLEYLPLSLLIRMPGTKYEICDGNHPAVVDGVKEKFTEFLNSLESSDWEISDLQLAKVLAHVLQHFKNENNSCGWIVLNAPAQKSIWNYLESKKLTPNHIVYCKSFKDTARLTKMFCVCGQYWWKLMQNETENLKNVFEETSCLKDSCEVQKNHSADIGPIYSDEDRKMFADLILAKVKQKIKNCSKDWRDLKKLITHSDCKTRISEIVIDGKLNVDTELYLKKLMGSISCLKNGKPHIFNDLDGIVYDPLNENHPFLSTLIADGIKIKNKSKFSRTSLILKSNYGDTYPYCPVSIFKNGVFVEGNTNFKVVYKNQIHIFCCHEFMEEFLCYPEPYLLRQPYTMPPPRINVLGSIGCLGSRFAKEIATELDTSYLSFDTLFRKQILGQYPHPVGVQYESKWCDNYPLPNNLNASDTDKHMIEMLRAYINCEEVLDLNPLVIFQKLMKPFWCQFPHNVQGTCYYRFPHTTSDLKFLIEKKCVPDVIIYIQSPENAVVNRVKDVKLQWQLHRAIIKKSLYERDIKEMGRYMKNLKELFNQNLQNLVEEQVKLGQEPKKQLFSDTSKIPPGISSLIRAFDLKLEQIRDPTLLCKALLSAKEQLNGYNSSPQSKVIDFSESLEPLEELYKLYTRETEEINKMKEISKENNILWVEQNVNDFKKDSVIKKVQLLMHLRSAAINKTQPVSPEKAIMLLENGIFFISRFAYQCPVQLLESDVPAQILYTNYYKSFPVIYRSYIYFLNSQEAMEKFCKNPEIYLNQNLCHFLQPLRCALIGPPKSGKTYLANRLAEEFKLNYVDVKHAVDYVLTELHFTKTAKKIHDHLQKERLLTDEMAVLAIEAALISPRSITQGWVLDGFPYIKEHFKALHKKSIVPMIVFTLETTLEKCLDNLTEDETSRTWLEKGDIEKLFNAWTELREADFEDAINDLWGNLTAIYTTNRPYFSYKEIQQHLFQAVKNYYNYFISIRKGQPTPLANVALSSAELFNHLNKCFGMSCPGCANYEDARTYPETDLCFYLVRKQIIQFKHQYYWVCPKHYNLALKEPTLCLKENTEFQGETCKRICIDSCSLEHYGNALEYRGYCIVCYHKSKPLSVLNKGSYQYIVDYQNNLYAMCSDHCFQQFTLRPKVYSKTVIEKWEFNPPQLIIRDLAIPLSEKLYIERSVLPAVKQGLSGLIREMPYIPGLTSQQSGCICLGYNLKCSSMQNDLHRDTFRASFRRLLEELNKLKSLINIVKTMSNPYHPENDSKMEQVETDENKDKYMKGLIVLLNSKKDAFMSLISEVLYLSNCIIQSLGTRNTEHAFTTKWFILINRIPAMFYGFLHFTDKVIDNFNNKEFGDITVEVRNDYLRSLFCTSLMCNVSESNIMLQSDLTHFTNLITFEEKQSILVKLDPFLNFIKDIKKHSESTLILTEFRNEESCKITEHKSNFKIDKKITEENRFSTCMNKGVGSTISDTKCKKYIENSQFSRIKYHYNPYTQIHSTEPCYPKLFAEYLNHNVFPSKISQPLGHTVHRVTNFVNVNAEKKVKEIEIPIEKFQKLYDKYYKQCVKVLIKNRIDNITQERVLAVLDFDKDLNINDINTRLKSITDSVDKVQMTLCKKQEIKKSIEKVKLRKKASKMKKDPSDEEQTDIPKATSFFKELVTHYNFETVVKIIQNRFPTAKRQQILASITNVYPGYFLPSKQRSELVILREPVISRRVKSVESFKSSEKLETYPWPGFNHSVSPNILKKLSISKRKFSYSQQMKGVEKNII